MWDVYMGYGLSGCLGEALLVVGVGVDTVRSCDTVSGFPTLLTRV